MANIYLLYLLLHIAQVCLIHSIDRNPLCDEIISGILMYREMSSTQYEEEKREDARKIAWGVTSKTSLNLYIGTEQLACILLNRISTPITIYTNDNNCMQLSLEKKSVELCFDLTKYRDEWWIHLSKQILCSKNGMMRNEVAGDLEVSRESCEKDNAIDQGTTIIIGRNDTSKSQNVTVANT